MGRPREFDADVALDSAMREFWARGYHATSLSHLVASTGLHRGSLYAAFGAKHALFVAALRRYSTGVLEQVDADLDGPPLAGIRRLMVRQASRAAAVGGRGCLIANAALELLPGDADVRRVIDRHHEAILTRLSGALDRAVAAGEIPGGRPSASLARYLLTVVQGLWELGRLDHDPEALIDVTDVALRALVESR